MESERAVSDYLEKQSSKDSRQSATGFDPPQRGGSPGKVTLTSALPVGAAANASPEPVAPIQRKEHGPTEGAASQPARGGGTQMAPAVRAGMEASFGADFSAVRIHEGPQAAAMGAQAYTQGTDIHFQPGGYDPHSPQGRELLGHELTHVVQQGQGRVEATTQLKGAAVNASPALEREADEMGSRVASGPAPGGAGLASGLAAGASATGGGTIQRREVATEAEITGTGDWTTQDRESNTLRWKNACLHNLQAGDSSQYVKIAERRDFYRWFYAHTVDMGYETRWALAASIVANGAQQVAYPGVTQETLGQQFGSISNELQGFMRLGNQVIFDDVFPKLQRLLAGGPLTGDAALRWDMATLSEEQALVQTLYDGMSPRAREQMATIAKQQGFVVSVGRALTSEDTVTAGVGPDGRAGTADDHNRGGDVPAFPESGDLTSVDARWQYGMGLGNTFSPSGTGYNPSTHTRPAPRAGYTDGTALASVNTRQHLHMLDAEIDEAMGMASISNVQAILGQLTDGEKAELARDRRPDGGAYSSRLAMLVRVPRDTVVAALPASGAERDAFLASYDRLRPPR
jgi:hypothetical protein